jgi:type VI secretion system protein ImpF
MPPSNRETRVQLSVLDRLLDDQPKNREEAQPTQSQTIARLKDALRRDLEWLLNTRAFPEEIEEELEETGASVFTYGLPDFSSLAGGSQQTKTRLERALQRALEVFEPRLLNVTVKAMEGDDKGEKRTIRFLISGWLHMSPAPLQVSFDTRLQLARGEYRVVGE